MLFLNCIRKYKRRLLLECVICFAAIYQFVSVPVFAEVATWQIQSTESMVNHHDPLEIDKTLTLSKVIDLTMETHPDINLIASLEEESAAISERSKSWTAGASQIAIGYQSISTFRLNYGSANLMIPIWNFGQRDAQENLAKEAEKNVGLQALSIKLRVAGLVREALWNMALAKIRFEQAREERQTAKHLLETIKRRVEVGDLPLADKLLAETEFLQKQSVLIMAEAELMHTHKRYTSITRIVKVPVVHDEDLVGVKELGRNHPSLVAINGEIDRKQAEINALKAVGSGQTNVVAGILSDEGIDYRSNHAEFFNVGVVVPFGGSAHAQPQIAALNVELTTLTSQQEMLYRELEQAHHEAEHNMEVNEVELENANERKKVSEELLKMTQLAFSVGEIDLMDLLKIQSQTQQSILYAKERAVIMKRDIAFYNHAIGVVP